KSTNGFNRNGKLASMNSTAANARSGTSKSSNPSSAKCTAAPERITYAPCHPLSSVGDRPLEDRRLHCQRQPHSRGQVPRRHRQAPRQTFSDARNGTSSRRHTSWPTKHLARQLRPLLSSTRRMESNLP